MSHLSHILIAGTIATSLVDLWSLLRRKWLGTPLPDYGLVGRWIAHMVHGKFRHDAIAAAARVPGERALGWGLHYLTGLGFAALLLWMTGAREPTLMASLSFGIGTVAAPFLLMQPGMGAGIAARRSRNPAAARWQSLATHAVFGLGLYAAGAFLAQLESAGL